MKRSSVPFELRSKAALAVGLVAVFLLESENE